MGTLAVTPGELEGAAASLQRAGNDVSTVGVRSMRGTGSGDLGSPELEQAVAELSEASFGVVVALWNAVNLTGVNVAAAAAAYGYVDGSVMPRGGR
jgi:hypothetical protein